MIVSAIVGKGDLIRKINFPKYVIVLSGSFSALINLGYQRNAAEKALNQAAQDGTEISVQKLLRRALQVLAK